MLYITLISNVFAHQKKIYFSADDHTDSLYTQIKSGSLDCSANLENDILTLQNARISRTYKWNNGNIISSSLTDKLSGKVWKMNGNKPDLIFPGEAEMAENAVFSAKAIPQTSILSAHLEAEVVYTLGKLEVKRVFRIYPDCAAIACDLYFRGQSNQVWLQSGINLADMVNIEKIAAGGADVMAPVIEKIELFGKHWKISAVEFFDVTDRFNTLVSSVEALSYKPNLYRGNLLFAHDNISNNGIFMLKEAPTSNVQLAYPGGDFQTEYGTFRIIGAGINSFDLHPTEWRRGYGFVTGVYSGDERNPAINLVSIVSRTGDQINRVEVYSLQGKLECSSGVIQTKTAGININSLSRGMYILRICNDLKDEELKIIKL